MESKFYHLPFLEDSLALRVGTFMLKILEKLRLSKQSILAMENKFYDTEFLEDSLVLRVRKFRLKILEKLGSFK